MYRVEETEEYQKWFSQQRKDEQIQIDARIARIREFGHFGFVRQLEDRLAELKWKNGRRIYFTLMKDENENLIILLLGGNKNSQIKDIKKSKSILEILLKDNFHE